MSGKKKFELYLSRRIMGPNGWMFFCRLCGKYVDEEQFYHKKGGKWGLDAKCKIHYTRTNEDDDPEMAYLKLDPIKESESLKLTYPAGFSWKVSPIFLIPKFTTAISG